MSKILKNIIIALSGSVGSNLFAFISTVLISRHLGSELFGVFAWFVLSNALIESIMSYRSWQVLVKYWPGMDSLMKGKLTYELGLLDLLLFGSSFFIVFFAGKSILLWFNIPLQYHLSYLFYSSLLFLKPLDLTIGIFRITDRFDIYAQVITFNAFVKFILILGVTLYSSTASVQYIVLTVVFSELIGAGIKFYQSYKILSFKNIKITSSPLRIIKRKAVLNFIKFNYLDALVRSVSRNIDSLVVAKLLDIQTLGILKLTKDIGGIILKIIDPITQVLFPEFSKNIEEKVINNAQNMTKSIVKYSVLFAVILYSNFLIFGNSLVLFIYGNEYELLFKTLLIYLIPILIAAITASIYSYVLAAGKVKSLFRIQLISTAVYLFLIYTLTEELEIFGPLWAYLLYYIIWTILLIKINNKTE